LTEIKILLKYFQKTLDTQTTVEYNGDNTQRNIDIFAKTTYEHNETRRKRHENHKAAERKVQGMRS